MMIMVVLAFDAPDPESVGSILLDINPPGLLYFKDLVDVVAGEHATELAAWLNE